MEALCLHHEVVLISNLLLDFLDGVTREARDDTVDERCAYEAVLREPLLEALIVGSEVVLPQLNVLVDALLQMMAVEEDELAWHKDHTLRRVAIEVLVAVEEQLHELAGIRCGRSIGELAGVIEVDACLCGVGNDETHLWLLCQSHECLVLCVWIECAADNVYAGQRVYGLTVLFTLKIYVVEAVLAVEPVNHATVNRLNNDNAGVEVGLLVHVVDNPVNECTEEVSLTELNDSFWHNALRSGALVQRL